MTTIDIWSLDEKHWQQVQADAAAFHELHDIAAGNARDSSTRCAVSVETLGTTDDKPFRDIAVGRAFAPPDADGEYAWLVAPDDTAVLALSLVDTALASGLLEFLTRARARNAGIVLYFARD